MPHKNRKKINVSKKHPDHNGLDVLFYSASLVFNITWLKFIHINISFVNQIGNTQNTTYRTILSYPTTIYSGVNNANLTVFTESVTSVLPLINAPFLCYAV